MKINRKTICVRDHERDTICTYDDNAKILKSRNLNKT